MPDSKLPYPGPPSKPEDHPRYVRAAKNLRAAFNEIYPMVLALTATVLFVLTVVDKNLRDQQIGGVIGIIILAASGFAYRRHK